MSNEKEAPQTEASYFSHGPLRAAFYFWFRLEGQTIGEPASHVDIPDGVLVAAVTIFVYISPSSLAR
jgi:hypothetical protein